MTSPDSSPEAAFFRQLQHVTTRIHDTDNLEQIMLDTSPAICQLLGADRFTLYVVNDEHTAIVSRVKTGLNTAKELKLPIGTQSIAGFVAQTQRTLNIADVYDDAELQRIDPQLTFLQQVDHRSGYRTRQMLVAPIVRAGLLQGVFQVVNRTSGGAFGALEQEGVQQLCETLSSAIRQRVGHTLRTSMLSSRYHGLVADGVVTADELTRCMQAARAQSIPVEKALVAELGVTPAQLGASMARFFQTSYVPFDAKRLRSDSLQGKLKREFVLAHHWIPLEDTPTGLLVMTLDPEDVRNSRIVPQVFPQFAKCVYAVTTVAEFEQTVEQFWGAHTKEDSVEDLLADLAPADTEADSNESALASAAQDNDLVKFVNKAIIDGYRQGASDIHFEPQPGKAKAGIRFRIDGSLQPYAEVPASYRDAIVARLKIMCDLDISEKRKPQDGKIKFKKYGPLDIELRVATLPSAGGVEDVVMRILAAGEPIALDKLGLTPHNRERLVTTISKPYGLFYVCGPTGSGKTTTLHSILKHLNTPETKIWTAEDPVEITQKGLRQVQVNKKAGIDFALVMRAFLRADPDIIMVGESRDKETVSMGVEASLTGHLVFSTLHTNSAPESITRLLDMGMDPFNFADALLGILAQRLAKRLCVCKETYVPTPDELQAFASEYALEYAHTPTSQVNPAEAAQRLIADWMQQHGQDGTLKLYRATGCETCRGTGYKGRVGLHELLIADNATRKLIQERARVADLSTACITAGMHTLKMDGMEKVLLGLTDLKQVRAVCMK